MHVCMYICMYACMHAHSHHCAASKAVRHSPIFNGHRAVGRNRRVAEVRRQHFDGFPPSLAPAWRPGFKLTVRIWGSGLRGLGFRV